jgi:hypothetical protein
MKFNHSLLLSACLLSSFGIYADSDMPLTDLAIQEKRHVNPIFLVKTVQDFNTVVQMHRAVLTCIFDPYFTTLEVMQEMLQEISQAINLPIVCVIINIEDIPNIKLAYPFTTPATLVSFVDGEKREQIDIDLKAE